MLLNLTCDFNSYHSKRLSLTFIILQYDDWPLHSLQEPFLEESELSEESTVNTLASRGHFKHMA